MIKLTDTHAHYDDDAFDNDREELLTRLFEESVGKIMENSATRCFSFSCGSITSSIFSPIRDIRY